ncbi:MAG: lactonase family protein [Chloroflexi bacterium]|nr:lactonase family protein [Chloroflexota bacterium]
MQRVYIILQGDDKIAIYDLESATGDLTHQEDVSIIGGPAPFAVSSDNTRAYIGLRDALKMASFDIDPSSGSLKLSGTVTLESDPCYISVDNTGHHLLSAYYTAGHIAVHPIDEQGALGGAPTEWIATRHRAHCAQTDSTNLYTFLPHVDDSNAIYQYKFDASTGNLTPNIPAVIEPPTGDGPRHYVYHPNGRFVYFDNEQGCSVTAYKFDSATGTLEAFQTLSTLPADWSGKNSCAQIHMSPDGKFLYAANRGHNSIAMYTVNAQSGELTSLGQQPSLGTPRAFGIDPIGNFMLVGGLDNGDLATYKIESSGKLNHLGTQLVGNKPMWIHITDPI